MTQIQRLGSLMILAMLGTTASAQVAGPKLPAGIKVHSDLAYVPNGHARQKLDLYVPENSGPPTPVIVWIHGGAWRVGSKAGSVPALSFMEVPALGFPANGYALASINYRLSQHAVFPAQIEDCKAAIRWLRANAKTYNLDPDHIGVWGASAGGHLAALLGTTADVEDLAGTGGNPDQSSRVQAVVDFFAPIDFLQVDAHSLPGSPLVHNSPDSPESQLIGGPIQENAEKVKRANPLTYVSKNAPPFLIVHGEQDSVIPIHQSDLLHDALKQAHCTVSLLRIPGADHGGPEFSSPTVRAEVEAFFDKHLKPATAEKASGTKE